MPIRIDHSCSAKAGEREVEEGVNVIVSHKRKSSGLTLPVSCQRPVGFLWSGLSLPAAMVTRRHGLRKKGKASLTLLFYSACHTCSLSGPGGRPHLVLAPLCPRERGGRGWGSCKTVPAQSARVADQLTVSSPRSLPSGRSLAAGSGQETAPA